MSEKSRITLYIGEQEMKRLTALAVTTKTTKSEIIRALLNPQNHNGDSELVSKVAAAAASEFMPIMPILASFDERIGGLEGAILSLVDALTTTAKPAQPTATTQPADAQKTAAVDELPSLKEFVQKNIAPRGPVETEAEYKAYAIQKYEKKYGVKPTR